MDDVNCRQVVATRDRRVARIASRERTAFIKQARPGGPVDGAVHPATTQQRPVGRVDDRIHRELRDVPDNNHHPFRRSLSGSSQSSSSHPDHPAALGVSVTDARVK